MRADEEADYLRDRVAKLENSLNWIYMLAFQHYIGHAFEPEHMRTLANMAADALNENPRFAKKPLPDYREAMDKAREQAEEWSQWLSSIVDDDEDEEEEDDGASTPAETGSDPS